MKGAHILDHIDSIVKAKDCPLVFQNIGWHTKQSTCAVKTGICCWVLTLCLEDGENKDSKMLIMKPTCGLFHHPGQDLRNIELP